MKITILSEHGYDEALMGLGLSFGKTSQLPDMASFQASISRQYMRERAERLAGMGGGHDKFLRAICVWLSITAPLYWWKQFDTYKVGTVTQSESTMHTLMKEGLSSAMFEGGYPCVLLNCIRLTGSFERLNRWLPQSYLQKRIVQTNYAALASMLAQRAQHKLPEWRLFCTQIRTDVQHPELLA